MEIAIWIHKLESDQLLISELAQLLGSRPQLSQLLQSSLQDSRSRSGLIARLLAQESMKTLIDRSPLLLIVWYTALSIGAFNLI